MTALQIARQRVRNRLRVGYIGDHRRNPGGIEETNGAGCLDDPRLADFPAAEKQVHNRFVLLVQGLEPDGRVDMGVEAGRGAAGRASRDRRSNHRRGYGDLRQAGAQGLHSGAITSVSVPV